MAEHLIAIFGKCAGTYMNELVFNIAKRCAKLHVELLLKQIIEGANWLQPYNYWSAVLVEVQNFKFPEAT